MLYGISGAHRSGKTTLARKISEDLNIEFYETSTTKVAREFGFDPCAPMTLSDRVALQVHLLNNHLTMINKLPRPLIVDRTPLDFLGYTMGEFHMQSHLLVDPETLAIANTLIDQCLEATALNYDMVFFLSRLDGYAIDPTKSQPAENPVYQRHHAMLIQGALMELEGQLQFAVIDDTDFDFRRDYVHSAIVARIDQIDQQRNTAPFH
jgi:hypothetical protein